MSAGLSGRSYKAALKPSIIFFHSSEGTVDFHIMCLIEKVIVGMAAIHHKITNLVITSMVTCQSPVTVLVLWV